MKLIGRRLTFAFTPETNIQVTKLAKNLYELDNKSGVIENVYEMDGEILYKIVGSTPECAYGKDVNTLITNGECWVTELELEKIINKHE